MDKLEAVLFLLTVCTTKKNYVSVEFYNGMQFQKVEILSRCSHRKQLGVFSPLCITICYTQARVAIY